MREAVELVNAGRLLEAESLLIEWAESSYSDAATRCQLARLALEIEKPHLARGLLDLALKSAPRSPEVRFLAGVSERALGHWSDAIDHFKLAQPESYPDAAYYLSLTQESLGNLRDAEKFIRLALELHPDDADYLNQAACVAARLGSFDDALELSGKAQLAEPDSAGFAFNHAQNLLLAGRSQEAWPLFESRLAFTPGHLFPANGASEWEGQSLNDKSLLVWHEQGIGDSLQFCRYLPVVARMAGGVVFRCQPELAALLSPVLPGVHVVPAGSTEPQTDFHIPLLSLPGRLGCDLTTPPPSPFFTSDPPRPIRRIGFVCSGNPDHPDDASRSIPLNQFEELFDTNFEWFCLQKCLRRGESVPARVAHPARGFRDWHDTAEFLNKVELVISADTAVAHLAASLGKPTWILLPRCPDWRWGRTGESTPWYPSARLFRQTTPGDWPSVIQKITNALNNS